MNTSYFDAAVNGIEQAFLTGEYDASLIAAQTLEASLFMEREGDPDQLGWARYYTVRNLHALGAWREGYNALARPSPRPFSLSLSSAAWMNAAGAEMAARLGLQESALKFLKEALALRLKEHDEIAAIRVCREASRLLDTACFSVFAEYLADLPYSAPAGGEAALMVALLYSEVAGQPWFMEALAAPERRQRGLARALRSASSRGDLATVDMTLAAGADPDDMVATAPGLPTPLMAAAFEGNAAVVSRLLTAGAELELSNLQGRAPLQLAAMRGHGEVVKLLLAVGASIVVEDIQQKTALHAAVEAGSTKSITALLEADADLEHRDTMGQTPLIIAARAGDLRVVCLLLCWGADIQACDDQGMTALERAILSGHPDAVAALTL